MNRQLLRIDSPKAWDNTQKPDARGKTFLEEIKKTSKCFPENFEMFFQRLRNLFVRDLAFPSWENEASVRFKHETWRESARQASGCA